MKQWFERHAQTLVGSLGRLWQQPFATLLTVIVIGIALALPACLHVLVQNVRTASGGWNNALDISVYLKPEATLEQARRAADRIEQRRDVDEVSLIEADEALKEFRRNSGFGEALDALKDNPLPHALVVRPDAAYRDPAHVATLTQELEKIDGVDIVQLDTEWVSRFNAILDVIRRGVFLAAGLFALGILVIVGNTIRLDIENRRDEIEVTKLVGGSDAFVRRPFLYNGVWYGLAGGITAGVIVAVVVGTLSTPVQRIAGLYGSQFQLQGVGAIGWLALLAGGVALGWLGSFIVATRELREIEPK
ncbi:MAG TPA: permease-like cell division protein FtsX [Steroidobacteraceae bacterium]|nr:permease-like cell division protein FtsX [Steroidobacteraceae bacterium]